MGNKITFIKIYDIDINYHYENIFIVEKNEKKEKELKKLIKKLKSLDYYEISKQYDYDSIIDIIENYIANNFNIVKFDTINLDCNI